MLIVKSFGIKIAVAVRVHEYDLYQAVLTLTGALRFYPDMSELLSCLSS
jgi:hypothetical protein